MMRWIGWVFTCFIFSTASAQENSPYSRYGLGDLTPNQNIINRAMGGIAAGYSDPQSVNFINPASLGHYRYNAVFDFGAEIDTRVLKSTSPAEKFSSTNLSISYIQLGLPLKLRKANKKGLFMGLSFGLKPVSKISYKILNNERQVGIDSIATLYEGSGGISEFNLGYAIKFKGLSLGVNSGWRFGNKDYSTKLSFSNDTLPYYQSNSGYKTNFGGIFFNVGGQYDIFLKNKALLRIGGYGNLSQTMKGTENIVKETVNYDASGNMYRVDSVFASSQSGTVVYPANLGVGFTYMDSSYHWLVGADYTTTYWNKYKFFDQTDKVQNSWRFKAGAEYLPVGKNNIKTYWSAVKYRAGFYYGKDYINIGNDLPEFGFTFGAGFPLKLRKSFYETQTSYLNTSIEIGSQGDKKSKLRESTFRLCIGLSLADLWFNRQKYY